MMRRSLDSRRAIPVNILHDIIPKNERQQRIVSKSLRFDQVKMFNVSNQISVRYTQKITNHSPIRLKKDPFWDELLETGGKRYYKHCTKSYYMDTDLSTIKSHFKQNHPGRWNELNVDIKANVEP